MFHEFFTPLDFGLLICVIPSSTIYIMVITVIIKFRNEHPFNKSSFFHLCVILGVLDCFQLLFLYTAWKLPSWGVFSAFFVSFKYWPNVNFFTTNLLIYTQYFLVTTIAVNRYLLLTRTAMANEVRF